MTSANNNRKMPDAERTLLALKATEVHAPLSEHERAKREQEVKYEGEAILLGSRLDEVERQQAEANRRDEDYKRQQVTTNKRIAGFTGCLVLTSLIAGGVAIYQARITTESANAARSAAATAESTFNLNKQYATDTLSEIRKQTKTQQDSVAVSRASLESVQRAFVVAREPQTQSFPVRDTTKWEINAVWENAGNTAALRMIQHFEAQILANEPDEGTFKGKVDVIDSAFVGPKVVQRGSPILRDNEFLDVKKRPPRDQQRFLWGWAAYDDVFPKTKMHITEFCYAMSGQQQFSDGRIRMEFNNCHKHNCVDEECEDYSSMVRMALQLRRKK